ncbi:MAG: hypothetical protein QOD77_1375 [Thermoplasmata archaeon]|jgi:GxxExxY protein|nr:hypothetical protein [Thermoplasmata archaeon]
MRNDARTFAIIGAAMKVHRELRPGYLESVYQEALGVEFKRRGIPAESEVPLTVWYDGVQLTKSFRADYICHKSILVELKALDTVGRREVGQLANYLAVTRLPVGLLLNFGSSELQFIRVVGRHAEPARHTEEAFAGHAARQPIQPRI